MKIEFICLFVVLSEDQKIRYHSQKMYGVRYPRNNSKDIIELCMAANKEIEENYVFIDLFGVLDAQGVTVWREDISESKVSEEFVAPSAPAVDTTSQPVDYPIE